MTLTQTILAGKDGKIDKAVETHYKRVRCARCGGLTIHKAVKSGAPYQCVWCAVTK